MLDCGSTDNIEYMFQDIDFENELVDIIRLFFTSPARAEQTTEFDKRGLFLNGRAASDKGREYYMLALKTPETSDGDRFTVSIPLEGGIPQKFDIMERRAFKCELRKGIYNLLSDYTGRKQPWGMLTGIRPAKLVHEMLDENLSKVSIISRLQDHYKVSGPKARLLYDVALTEKKILGMSGPKDVSLYIGIPFCPSRCLYCSFTSNAINGYRHIVSDYLAALKTEIEFAGDLLKKSDMTIQSLYIGGGTPTSLDNTSLKSLLDFIEDTLDLAKTAEYTIEAGRPDSLDRHKLETIKQSAANRISINPQSMNESTLRLIGRGHTPEDIVRAFEMARETGLSNINADVIAGLPGEDAAMFRHTLDSIKQLSPESLTVHTLAIKRASRLNLEDGEYTPPDACEISSMIDDGGRYANEMGMHPYYLYRQKNILGNLENVGYCKPGCESIYNVQIMEEKQTILAVGAGAVTKVVYPEEDRIERAFNVKNVQEYINRIDEMLQRKRLLLAF